MCRPLKSIDFLSLLTAESVLQELDAQLLELAEIAIDVDLSDGTSRAQFQRNITFIKGYFERLERLVLDAN